MDSDDSNDEFLADFPAFYENPIYDYVPVRPARTARRPYTVQERISIDNWDDVDFAQRFRLSKSTVLQILELIRQELTFDDPRFVFLLSESEANICSRSITFQLTIYFPAHSIVDNVAVLCFGINAIGDCRLQWRV